MYSYLVTKLIRMQTSFPTSIKHEEEFEVTTKIETSQAKAI
jgi:hypothetical protein